MSNVNLRTLKEINIESRHEFNQRVLVKPHFNLRLIDFIFWYYYMIYVHNNGSPIVVYSHYIALAVGHEWMLAKPRAKISDE